MSIKAPFGDNEKNLNPGVNDTVVDSSYDSPIEDATDEVFRTDVNGENYRTVSW
jgi:hypothetical protein